MQDSTAEEWERPVAEWHAGRGLAHADVARVSVLVARQGEHSGELWTWLARLRANLDQIEGWLAEQDGARQPTPRTQRQPG